MSGSDPNPATISVVTRTFNRPDALARAAAALAAQDRAFEWVVVNAGDAPVDVPGDCVVVSPDGNPGRALAAKLGVEAASGALLMLHDDDDTLEPGALGVLADALKAAPHAAAVTCGYAVIEEDGGAERELSRHAYDLPISLYDMAERNRILTVGTLFRRSAYDASGGMRTEVDALEDWDLWLRMMCVGDIVTVPDVLARQYVRPAETDGPDANSARDEHERARVLLQNRWLRDDIAAGRTGLGEITHRPHARFVEEVDDRLRRAGAIKRKLMPWART